MRSRAWAAERQRKHLLGHVQDRDRLLAVCSLVPNASSPLLLLPAFHSYFPWEAGRWVGNEIQASAAGRRKRSEPVSGQSAVWQGSQPHRRVRGALWVCWRGQGRVSKSKGAGM